MTDPARGNRMLTAAFALFAIGLVAVVVIFVLAMMDRQAPWLWMLTMGLPLGLLLGVAHAVRTRRAP
jgi:FtsH-binding integral membrane protein